MDRPSAGPRRWLRAPRWLPWLVGVATVITLIAVATEVSEGRQLVELVRESQPEWLLVALGLQAATYFAQGESWRIVARAARFRLRVHEAYELSLAKLFIDQAIPAGGLSGTLVVAEDLEARGMARPAVMASVIVDSVAYHITYVLCLGGALAIAFVDRETNRMVGVSALVFAVVALTFTVLLLVYSGRLAGRLAQRVHRLRPLRVALEYLAAADPRLVRSPRLIAASALCQLGVFLLDAGTLYAVLAALGAEASAPSVFASFMISMLFRTIGILPAGLGSFETASVLTLHLLGVDLTTALAATLLFRGFDFWLPMIPGVWASRAITARARRSG